jgi:hypothetical protein
MKINPFQFWYPGHNSIYYNNVQRGALAGPVRGDTSRVNSGALRNWFEPTMTPACVIHIKRETV